MNRLIYFAIFSILIFLVILIGLMIFQREWKKAETYKGKEHYPYLTYQKIMGSDYSLMPMEYPGPTSTLEQPYTLGYCP